MSALPAHPATATEQYLAAILAVLEEIRDRLPQPGGQGELREPGTPTTAAKKGPDAASPPRRPARTTRTATTGKGGKT